MGDRNPRSPAPKQTALWVWTGMSPVMERGVQIQAGLLVQIEIESVFARNLHHIQQDARIATELLNPLPCKRYSHTSTTCDRDEPSVHSAHG